MIIKLEGHEEVLEPIVSLCELIDGVCVTEDEDMPDMDTNDVVCESKCFDCIHNECLSWMAPCSRCHLGSCYEMRT